MPDDWRTDYALSLLGCSLAGQKKYGDAEPLLTGGYEGMKEREARMPADAKGRIEEAREGLLQLYEKWGKAEEAKKWRSEKENQSQPEPSSQDASEGAPHYGATPKERVLTLETAEASLCASCDLLL